MKSRLGLMIGIVLAVAGVASAFGYPPKMPGAHAVVYRTVGETSLSLYIFNPKDWKATDKRPAILFFFGGGWKGGSPSQFEHHSNYFASRGMVAIAADYRVRSRNHTTPPDAVADARAAIRWVRAHAGELGIDPDRIVSSGGSAGGHLAACLGVCPAPATDNSKVSDVPNAMVLFNPVLDLRQLGQKESGPNWMDISPVDHVHANQPPAVMFFGENDHFLIGAKKFVEECKKDGDRCELHVYPGQKHGFFNKQPYLDQTVQTADAFLVSLGYLTPKPAATGAAK